MMSRKEPLDLGSESNDAATQVKGVPAHIAAVAAATPPPFGNSYGSLSNTQQFPFVDMNAMMMSNAAATIAAVAASAVLHMTQGKASSSPTAHPGVDGSTSHMPHGAFVAALQDARKPLMPAQAAHTPLHSTIPPHVAALLGATPGGQHSIPFQNPVAGSAPASSQLHHVLNPGESASTLYPTAAPAAAIQSGSMSNALLPQMQTWSAEQLEKHTNYLQQVNQPVTHSVALLLSDARRKQKKKTAKRSANRMSASTSRARKKALVEEMTRTNERLRRQAMILSLLPDLVIAITTEGEITFCSAQVERVLQHEIDDLVGAKLHNLLTHTSRDDLSTLIKELVSSDKSRASRERRGTKRRMSDQRNSSDTTESKAGGETANGNSHVSSSSRSAHHSGIGASAVAIVSELSFPLSVVEVQSKQSARAPAETNENSDSSASNGGKQPMSSLTNSLSPTASSSGEDDGARGGGYRGSVRAASLSNGKRLPSGDDSSLSSEAKNMRKANENLDRNVRCYNKRMMGDIINKNKSDSGPKDDVTGASVTANNATARLSSLIHVPEPSKTKEDKSSRYESIGDQSSSDDSLLVGVEEKKGGNASDDSGYRESNDSREETSSSESDTSKSNDRKPLAPARRMCLIRQDLTTVWCEVTSSIRTRSSDEETPEHQPTKSVKELLLCLRPIRDGEKKVDESLRFVSQKGTAAEDSLLGPEGMVSSSSGDANNKEDRSSSEKNTTSGSGSNSHSATASSQSQEISKLPLKKRPLSSNEESLSSGEETTQTNRKRTKLEDSRESSHVDDPEESVVESLMRMNKSQ